MKLLFKLVSFYVSIHMPILLTISLSVFYLPIHIPGCSGHLHFFLYFHQFIYRDVAIIYLFLNIPTYTYTWLPLAFPVFSFLPINLPGWSCHLNWFLYIYLSIWSYLVNNFIFFHISTNTYTWKLRPFPLSSIFLLILINGYSCNLKLYLYVAAIYPSPTGEAVEGHDGGHL